jgi:hypothetical protein
MKKISAIILTIIISLSTLISVPVFAECGEGCVPTSILGGGCVCDDSPGDSITNVLGLVIDIMTIGIGILGVIGISVVGIQYLTAGGNEEKTRKAKRRLFEIIIGLAVYALMYAILQWLNVGPLAN